MPTVPVYIRERIYRVILAEAKEKGLPVTTLIKNQVEKIYESKALQAKRA